MQWDIMSLYLSWVCGRFSLPYNIIYTYIYIWDIHCINCPIFIPGAFRQRRLVFLNVAFLRLASRAKARLCGGGPWVIPMGSQEWAPLIVLLNLSPMQPGSSGFTQLGVETNPVLSSPRGTRLHLKSTSTEQHHSFFSHWRAFPKMFFWSPTDLG